ncbi:MAG TPA: exo-alpha-sialidase [Caldilineae bacterium]|nr:exo-alpha-sialidase [Caldilineae bacterium]
MRHITVYREKGRFAGWPANYGIWSWGDEIIVGFTVGYTDPKGGFHARDKSRPFLPMQARSLDGGLTWEVQETPARSPGNRGFSADEHMQPELSARRALELGLENAPVDCPGGIDFTHPDFALMCARTGLGAGTVAWFYISYDRCHTWEGPFRLPMFGQPGIEARTDYLVFSSRECMLFLTASKAGGGEGGGVFCARTTDGGRTFDFVSWVVRTDRGFAIMPASVRLSESRIVVAVRRRGGRLAFVKARSWIDLYASDDNGMTWAHLNTPVPDTGKGGNPPALVKLHDGRLCLIYGYRAEPYGIRAKLSADGGVTWGEEIVLRDDGGNHDLGYPRAVQRPDGTLVTVYYFNDHPDGERYIAATLWKP